MTTVKEFEANESFGCLHHSDYEEVKDNTNSLSSNHC